MSLQRDAGHQQPAQRRHIPKFAQSFLRPPKICHRRGAFYVAPQAEQSVHRERLCRTVSRPSTKRPPAPADPGRAAGTTALPVQGSATLSASRSSARVRPRLSAAIGLPISAIARREAVARQHHQRRADDQQRVGSLQRVDRTADGAFGTFSPKNTTFGLPASAEACSAAAVEPAPPRIRCCPSGIPSGACQGHGPANRRTHPPLPPPAPSPPPPPRPRRRPHRLPDPAPPLPPPRSPFAAPASRPQVRARAALTPTTKPPHHPPPTHQTQTHRRRPPPAAVTSETTPHGGEEDRTRRSGYMICARGEPRGRLPRPVPQCMQQRRRLPPSSTTLRLPAARPQDPAHLGDQRQLDVARGEEVMQSALHDGDIDRGRGQREMVCVTDNDRIGRGAHFRTRAPVRSRHPRRC